MRPPAHPVDRILSVACPIHAGTGPGDDWNGPRWVTPARADTWTCGQWIGKDENGENVRCGSPPVTLARSTVAEAFPPLYVPDPELVDFVSLVRDMADAGVVVAVAGNRLVLRHRRGRVIPPELVSRAVPLARLLLWTVVSRARWRVCDDCGLPQLVAKRQRCDLTPGCAGTLRVLPKVKER